MSGTRTVYMYVSQYLHCSISNLCVTVLHMPHKCTCMLQYTFKFVIALKSVVNIEMAADGFGSVSTHCPFVVAMFALRQLCPSLVKLRCMQLTRQSPI